MQIMFISFMIPIVCGILVLVTSILKSVKRMSHQVARIELKLLDIENRIR